MGYQGNPHGVTPSIDGHSKLPSSAKRFNKRQLIAYEANLRGKNGGVYEEESDIA